jgi:alpha-L-fucosidase
VIDLREEIMRGQVVSSYVVEARRNGADWRLASKGTTIGYKKLDRIPSTQARYVRLTIETVVPSPPLVQLRLFAGWTS